MKNNDNKLLTSLDKKHIELKILIVPQDNPQEPLKINDKNIKNDISQAGINDEIYTAGIRC